MTETTPASPDPAPAPPAPSIAPTLQETTVTAASPPEPDLDAIRAEAERAAVERIAAYEPVLAAARGLVTADMLDAMREAAIRDRISPEVLRGRLWDACAQSAPHPSLPARPETGPSNNDPSQLLDAMAEALAARSMPGYQP